MLFATYNLLEWDASDARFGPLGPASVYRRRLRVVEVIRTLATAAREAGEGLVIAVQELVVEEHEQPGAALEELADKTGLVCTDRSGRPVAAAGVSRLAVGLMWSRDRVTPAGELQQPFPGFWMHGSVMIDLAVPGAPTPIRHASHHAPPYPRRRRIDEAELLLAAARRPGADGIRPPVLIGSDTNSLSADRRQRPGQQVDDNEPGDDGRPYYDPEPPVWHPELVHQCHVQVDETGERRWRADRRPGQALLDGGLRDAAAVLETPWTPTTGHWSRKNIAMAGLTAVPGIEPDPFGPRRTDVVYASREITDEALCGLTVLTRPALPELADLLRTPRHRAEPDPVTEDAVARAPALASDHLPVVVRYRADAMDPPAT